MPQWVKSFVSMGLPLPTNTGLIGSARVFPVLSFFRSKGGYQVKIKSQLITQASGSVGGVTASRNKGGLYLRARAIPTNPNTSFQQVIRGFVAQLASLWNDTLTAAQRTAWKAYADNVPLLDKLGDPRVVPPLSHYIRSNVPRLQAGLPRVDDGPTTYNLGDYTPPTITSFTASTATLSLAFDDTDDWANEDDASMLVYGSRGLNATIDYFKGPFQYADSIDGDSTTAPTSPASIVFPFSYAVGQRVYMRCNVSRADGRLGTSQILFSAAG